MSEHIDSTSKYTDEELIRKAREYVEKHDDNEAKHRKRSRRDEDGHKDDGDDGTGVKSKGSSSEKKKSKKDSRDTSSKHRDRHSKKYRDRDRTHSKRSDHDDDSLSSERDRRRDRRSNSNSKSNSKKLKHDEERKKKHHKHSSDSRRSDSHDRHHHSHHRRSSRHDDDDNHKHKKSHKKKKDRKDHDEKHSKKRSSDSKPKSQDSFTNQKLSLLLGNIANHVPSKTITSDDYFAFHNHLRLYLYHSSGIYFEDLSSLKTHEAFDKFCKKYNAGLLEEAYYDTSMILPDEAMELCKRTKHEWNFKTNQTERQSLDMIKSGVKKQTEYQSIDTSSFPKASTTNTMSTHAKRPMVPERNPVPTMMEQSSSNPEDKQREMLKMLGLDGMKAGEKITIAPRK